MLKVDSTHRFKKDVKRLLSSGNTDFQKLKHVITLLADEKPLPEKYKPHKLTGNWNDHMECHIEPNWLLFYRIDVDNKILVLVRTGSHSELF